jgi:hypothetical protein
MGALLAEQGQRGIGTIVVGQNAAGPIIVVQTWRDDEPEASDGQKMQAEIGPSLAISYPLSGAGTPTMLRMTGSGARAAMGESEPTPAQIEVLSGLPLDSRLRVMSDRVLIRVPNYFSEAIAEDLLRRLEKLKPA